jgi:hypothetical protein
MLLTRDEKNQIYALIAKHGLDLTECSLTPTRNKVVISHDSGSKFEFWAKRSDNNYKIHYVVVDRADATSDLHMTGFESILVYIEDWAADVKDLTQTPDLWAEMQQSQGLIADVQRRIAANNPFSQDEQQQVLIRLQAIERSLDSFNIPSEQMQEIKEDLAEAAKARERLGRKDWWMFFLGTVTNMAANDIITPPVAQHIFTMAAHGLVHVFIGGSAPQILG